LSVLVLILLEKQVDTPQAASDPWFNAGLVGFSNESTTGWPASLNANLNQSTTSNISSMGSLSVDIDWNNPESDAKRENITITNVNTVVAQPVTNTNNSNGQNTNANYPNQNNANQNYNQNNPNQHYNNPVNNPTNNRSNNTPNKKNVHYGNSHKYQNRYVPKKERVYVRTGGVT
jgi:hypothetical protein